MRALRKLARLPARRRRIVLSSLVAVGVSRVSLAWLPFRVVEQVVARFVRPARREQQASADELAWAVTAVSSYVPRATCLVQAVALNELLRKHGHEGELRIGVAKDGDRLSAHAWVVSGGRILVGERGSDAYAPLSSAARE